MDNDSLVISSDKVIVPQQLDPSMKVRCYTGLSPQILKGGYPFSTRINWLETNEFLRSDE
jgi:hypothetical protein